MKEREVIALTLPVTVARIPILSYFRKIYSNIKNVYVHLFLLHTIRKKSLHL